MNKSILAALILANILVICGLARAQDKNPAKVNGTAVVFSSEKVVKFPALVNCVTRSLDGGSGGHVQVCEVSK